MASLQIGNVAFVPEFDGGFLTFETTASGDATESGCGQLCDSGSEGEVPVMNPSFEASGETLDPDGIISPAHKWSRVGRGTLWGESGWRRHLC